MRSLCETDLGVAVESRFSDTDRPPRMQQEEKHKQGRPIMNNKKMKQTLCIMLTAALILSPATLFGADPCYCARKLNGCTHVAGANFNRCVDRALKEGIECQLKCLPIALVNPWAGALCIGICELSTTSDLDECEDQYNQDIDSCEFNYQLCRDECGSSGG